VKTDEIEAVTKTNGKCPCESDWPTRKHGPAQEPHPCPYRADIYDDEETMCTCCEECVCECAMDI